MIARTPRIASTSASTSSSAPTTASRAPAARTVSARASRLTKPRTASSSGASAAMTARPVFPPAPVSRISAVRPSSAQCAPGFPPRSRRPVRRASPPRRRRRSHRHPTVTPGMIRAPPLIQTLAADNGSAGRIPNRHRRWVRIARMVRVRILRGTHLREVADRNRRQTSKIDAVEIQEHAIADG